MSKKIINQKRNYNTELINSIESSFIFEKDPINRFKNADIASSKNYAEEKINKEQKLTELKKDISSIEDCSIKKNSRKIVLGSGNINSPIMLIGEAPGAEEDKAGEAFLGEIGNLLKKMLIAINIKKENIYSSYAINFRPPEDRKPTTSEIKRYSRFLQNHISIIKPKIIILMGSTAMESVTGLNGKISAERGKWKEVIIKNINYDVIITFNPSYLLKAPENKKYSWEDLKNIKQKIQDLKITI